MCSRERSRASFLLGWFAGSHGDVFDQTVNFVSGFGDNVTFGASKAMRQWHGMDYVDQDSWAYFGGDLAGNFMPGPTAIAKSGTWAWRLYNKFDDLGDCASFFTKVVHGGCFVAGTKVTLSSLQRDNAFESSLWNKDEFDFAGVALSELMATAEHTVSGLEHIAGATATISSTTLPPSSLLQIPIEQVPIGARVPTRNPRPWEYDDTLPEPDQATWAKLSLTMYRDDGGIVDAELIRPRSWIKANGLCTGQLITMNIEELQVNGSALVSAIEECPEIADGEGSVVTARFCTREVHTIAHVKILGPDGQIEVLRGTTIHPIWSEDRQDWIPLGELEQGETLCAADGSAIVLSVTILSTSIPVYNIEVHGEHVYQVGVIGLLVHNSTPECAAALAKFPGSRVVKLPIRTAPGAKEFADPENLVRLGNKFSWNEYAPIIVRMENGVPTLYEGMTRVELALRAGITELPAFFLR